MSPPIWRAALEADLAAVAALAEGTHPDLPERIEVFADRLALFPPGFRVLASGGTLLGYAVSHPAPLFSPPPLDHRLGRLPPGSDAFYIHDVVVSPAARGAGQAARIVAELMALAAPWPAAALVSVYGTVAFWQRFGFRDATAALAPEKLAPYGPGACYMVRHRGA